MAQRFTNADMFALGMWAGQADAELADLIEGAPQAAGPLAALRGLIATAKDAGDLAILAKLRTGWDDAAA